MAQALTGGLAGMCERIVVAINRLVSGIYSTDEGGQAKCCLVVQNVLLSHPHHDLLEVEVAIASGTPGILTIPLDPHSTESICSCVCNHWPSPLQRLEQCLGQ